MIERKNNPADECAQPDAAACVHEVVLSLLRSEKAGCFLDVPTGEGAFAAHAKELGCEVSCGDIVPDRFRVPGLTCDRVDRNQRWPYPSVTFDRVTSIEAIEHLESPWHMIREAASIQFHSLSFAHPRAERFFDRAGGDELLPEATLVALSIAEAIAPYAWEATSFARQGQGTRQRTRVVRASAVWRDSHRASEEIAARWSRRSR